MALTDSIRAHDIDKEKEFSKMFDSNAKPLIDDLEFFNTHSEKIPIGMKRKSIFFELPYWEHLKIVHLLDPMHIFKNVSSSLWRHISSKKSYTLAIRRDLISSNTKNKQWPKKENRGEVGHSWSFKEGDVPWILKKDDLSVAKDVIFGGVEAPSLYGSAL